jgi:small-conductance mechanosensitive channel
MDIYLTNKEVVFNNSSLSNLAGGVMIMFFKPFKMGDFITAQGHSGSVNDIQIFNTYLPLLIIKL